MGINKKWDLDKVSQAIREIPECSIEAVGHREDYCTEQITVSVRNSQYSIYVRGFTYDAPLVGNEIELIEVATGYSDGDMPQDEPEYTLIHAKIRVALMKLGYHTCDSLEPYF